MSIRRVESDIFETLMLQGFSDEIRTDVLCCTVQLTTFPINYIFKQIFEFSSVYHRRIILSKTLYTKWKSQFNKIKKITVFKDVESIEECTEFTEYLAPDANVHFFYNDNTKPIAKDLSNLMISNDLDVPDFIKSDL